MKIVVYLYKHIYLKSIFIAKPAQYIKKTCEPNHENCKQAN